MQLYGVVHLGPLPGAARYRSRQEVRDAAHRDAEALVAGGLDGFVIENFGDVPFRKDRVGPVVVAEMTAIASRLRAQFGPPCTIGINVLRNDAAAALAIAAACDAQFIRVNVHTGIQYCDQGIIEGHADRTLRLRRYLGLDIEIAADVGVKHATPPAQFDLAQSAADTAYRGLADHLIVSGSGTGRPTALADLQRVCAAVPDRPVWIGSGASEQSVASFRELAAAVIVGTSIKSGGDVAAAVDRARVERFVAAARC